MQSRVLQIGKDELLLQTRAAILQHSGFTVENCLVTNRPDSAHFCIERYFDHANAEVDGNESHFDAVILCHTLDRERAVAIASEARREEPRLKVIVLEALDGPPVPAHLYDVSVSCKYGPATMVDVVTSVLEDGRQLDSAPPKTSRFPKDRAGGRGLQLVRVRQQRLEK